MDNKPVLPTDDTLAEKHEFEANCIITAKSIIELQIFILLKYAKTILTFFIVYEIIILSIINIASKTISLPKICREFIFSAVPVLLYFVICFFRAALKNKKVIGTECTYLFYNDHFKQISGGNARTISYSDCIITKARNGIFIVLTAKGGILCSGIYIAKECLKQSKWEDFDSFLKSRFVRAL